MSSHSLLVLWSFVEFVFQVSQPLKCFLLLLNLEYIYERLFLLNIILNLNNYLIIANNFNFDYLIDNHSIIKYHLIFYLVVVILTTRTLIGLEFTRKFVNCLFLWRRHLYQFVILKKKENTKGIKTLPDRSVSIFTNLTICWFKRMWSLHINALVFHHPCLSSLT